MSKIAFTTERSTYEFVWRTGKKTGVLQCKAGTFEGDFLILPVEAFRDLCWVGEIIEAECPWTGQFLYRSTTVTSAVRSDGPHPPLYDVYLDIAESLTKALDKAKSEAGQQQAIRRHAARWVHPREALATISAFA